MCIIRHAISRFDEKKKKTSARLGIDARTRCRMDANVCSLSVFQEVVLHIDHVTSTGPISANLHSPIVLRDLGHIQVL